MAQLVVTAVLVEGRTKSEVARTYGVSRRWVITLVQRFLADDVLTRVQQLRPIAEDLGLTMAQLAVAWVLQNSNVAAAIIGATRPEQVDDNVKAAGVTLDADVLKRIDEVLARHPPKSTGSKRLLACL